MYCVITCESSWCVSISWWGLIWEHMWTSMVLVSEQSMNMVCVKHDRGVYWCCIMVSSPLYHCVCVSVCMCVPSHGVVCSPPCFTWVCVYVLRSSVVCEHACDPSHLLVALVLSILCSCVVWQCCVSSYIHPIPCLCWISLFAEHVRLLWVWRLGSKLSGGWCYRPLGSK